jgi:hypothetical protein
MMGYKAFILLRFAPEMVYFEGVIIRRKPVGSKWRSLGTWKLCNELGIRTFLLPSLLAIIFLTYCLGLTTYSFEASTPSPCMIFFRCVDTSHMQCAQISHSPGSSCLVFPVLSTYLSRRQYSTISSVAPTYPSTTNDLRGPRMPIPGPRMLYPPVAENTRTFLHFTTEMLHLKKYSHKPKPLNLLLRYNCGAAAVWIRDGDLSE